MSLKRTATILLVAILAYAGVAEAQQYGKKELRRHYDFTDKSSGLAYRMTEIVQMPNDTQTVNVFLVEDLGGDRLTLTYTRDYLNQTSVLEIVDLQTKEYVRATSSFPFKSATRNETAKEARENPHLYESFDPNNTIELNGVSAEAKDSEWTTVKTRDRRSNLRRAASAQFLERLERLRPVVAKDPLDLFCGGLLRYVLYNEPCKSSVTVNRLHGDCDFDALFHYPCSDRQKGRLKDAITSGAEPGAY